MDLHTPPGRRMRLLVDTLIALMLIAVLGVLVVKQRTQRSELEQITIAQQSIHALESQALYRAAVGDAEAGPRGYAIRLDPAWFSPVPQNPLIIDHALRPWVDTVDEELADRFNPEHIIATGPLASFWYNPHRGLVRARVPEQLSQQATVDLYNLVNGTTIRAGDVVWSLPKLTATAAVRTDDARVDPLLRRLDSP